MVPNVFAPWAADFITLAALRSGERVLDVACGTGVVARLAAQHLGTAGEVTGLDLVTWIEASALAMPPDDASFDVVLCQQGFQFFPASRNLGT